MDREDGTRIQEGGHEDMILQVVLRLPDLLTGPCPRPPSLVLTAHARLGSQMTAQRDTGEMPRFGGRWALPFSLPSLSFLICHMEGSQCATPVCGRI